MKKFLIVLFSVIVLSGCAHCSVTETLFDGETKGFNPYGDGTADVTRTSFWGTSERLIRELIKKYYAIEAPENN